MGPSLDQLSLLYIINRYTESGSTPANGKSRFLKELHLSVLVYRAIESGVFRSYDWAPSLVEFHGVKVYGKVSQEAISDLRNLQAEKLVEKLHLSTCLYGAIRSYRATSLGAEALGRFPEEPRSALARLLQCRVCSTLQEIHAFVERNGQAAAGRNSSISYCPRCCTVARNGAETEIAGPDLARLEVGFFALPDVVYRSRPVLPVGFV